ncbi:MAG: DUF4831 family protein, partial [Paludibacter sp.]|nr:DUF4831 family protein [Paludibacter sp.]
MRKSMLVFLSVISACFTMAANPLKITEGKPVFVYSLPRTEFCIEIEIEKSTQKAGQFYQFSERYLATNQIITEDKTLYIFKNVTIQPLAIPDPQRTYIVENMKGFPHNFITVDKKGLLCGVNVPLKDEQPIKIEPADNQPSITPSKSPLPLSEEYLMAGSAAKLAEGVAKQIYRIRESRMTLLSGDMDHLPS